MTQLTTFSRNSIDLPITFIENQIIKEGVTCDIYTFDNDSSRDLAIVSVTKGFKTPLQKILSGTETIEGHVSGAANLKIIAPDGTGIVYDFPNNDGSTEIKVAVGETMQWEAESDLMFYEICTPPYEDGRFQNLPE